VREALSNPGFLITYALIQSVVFLVLIRFLDLYEREPLSVLALLAAWGATGAVAISLAGNALVLSLLSPAVREVFGPALSAPLVEEVAKGIALVAAFAVSAWAARRFGILELEGVTDGIVYGAAAGLGFAFTEDLLYLLDTAGRVGVEAGLGEYVSRVDFFGVGQLAHAVYTGVFGAGLGLASWSRSWWGRLGFPVLGLAAAMAMHAIHNGLAAFVLVARYGLENTVAARRGGVLRGVDYESMKATAEAADVAMKAADYVFLVIFLTLVAIWLRYQRRVIREELADEADAGRISREESELMPSYWRRSREYWRLLRDGKFERWRHLRRIHNEMADLAFLKRRRRRGIGDAEQVQRRRRRIANLRTQQVVE
jgi:RsiW-degrading membrane proteinase PrsW (M82 family)